MVATNSFHGVQSRNVGKESPQLIICTFRADGPKAQLTGNLPSMHVRSGNTSGSTIVPACSPQHPPFLRLERVIRLRWGLFSEVRGTRSTKCFPIDFLIDWWIAKRKESNDTQDTDKVSGSSVVYRSISSVCVFIKLHITTQSGPVILVILCHSH